MAKMGSRLEFDMATLPRHGAKTKHASDETGSLVTYNKIISGDQKRGNNRAQEVESLCFEL